MSEEMLEKAIREYLEKAPALEQLKRKPWLAQEWAVGLKAILNEAS